jgi:hypothetical protein
MMSPRPFDQQSWSDFTGEAESQFLDTVPFADTVDTSALDQVAIADFLPSDLAEFGANGTNLPELPRE